MMRGEKEYANMIIWVNSVCQILLTVTRAAVCAGLADMQLDCLLHL
jgi:hypothetical protein